MFSTVIIVIYQSVFHLIKIHQNNIFFYFLKFIFDISILKWYKINYLKKLIILKKIKHKNKHNRKKQRALIHKVYNILRDDMLARCRGLIK
jgi:hypothetical protein